MANPLEAKREQTLTVSQTMLNSQMESSKTLLEEFLGSAVHTGVQMPLEGVAQIADKITGSTNAQKSVHFMDAPVQAEFLSSKWLAQQGGSAVGMLPWFVAAHKGCGAILGKTSLAPTSALKLAAEGEKLTLTQAMQVNGFKALESAGAGLFVGGVLTPVGPEDKDSFLSARLRHATSSALTFSTLSLTASSLRLGADKLAHSAPRLSAVLGNDAAAGLMSGIPAGLVGAHSESLLAGKGWAKREEVGKQITTFGILGFGFGALNSRSKPELKNSADYASGAPELRVTTEILPGGDAKAIARPITGTVLVPDSVPLRVEPQAVGGKNVGVIGSPTTGVEALAIKRTAGIADPAPRLTDGPLQVTAGDAKVVGEGAAKKAADAPKLTPGEANAVSDAAGRKAVDGPAAGNEVKAPDRTGGRPNETKGEVKTELPNGDLVIEKPNGITIIRAKNGDTTVRQKDGTSVTTQTDGWVIKRDAAGVEVERNRPKGKTPLAEREFNVASMNVDPLAKEMSNLNQRPFVLDGVKFESVEGFYRWIQWSAEPAKAAEMAGLYGKEARAAGKGCTHTHATFRGKTFELGSPEHHEVIKIGIRESLRQNPDLAKRFAETHPRPIIHNTGRAESRNTKLPGTVFSRILMEVRQEIVDGKLKPDEPLPVDSGKPVAPENRAAPSADRTDAPSDRTSAPTDKPGVLLADALRLIDDPAIHDRHPVEAYARALANSDLRVSGFIGAGYDCIVFEMNGGKVLKVTGNHMPANFGTRPIDLPLLDRGAAQDGRLTVHWFTQPLENKVPTTDQVRQFGRELDPKKYVLTDPDPNNLRIHDGKVRLSDYWAVELMD